MELRESECSLCEKGSMMNWDEVRQSAWSRHPPPAEWPSGVRPIGTDGLGLFGLDASNQLYWDGKPIKIERRLRLTAFQVGLVIVATGVTAVQAIVEVLSYLR